MTTAQSEIDQWNTTYPRGTAVSIRCGKGPPLLATTTSLAFRVPNADQAAICVKGVAGHFPLSRVTAIPTEKP